MPRPPLEIGTWGSIACRELPTGLWCASARFRDTDGVTRRVEARGASRGKAQTALTAKLRARKAPTVGGLFTPNTRLRELTEKYLQQLQDAGRAPRTLQRYRETIDNHVLKSKGGAGDLRLCECTTGRVEAFLQGIREDHGTASAKIARTVLIGLFELAEKHDAIKGNPAKATSAFTTTRKEVRALTEREVQTLRRRLAAWQAEELPNGRHSRADDLLDVVDIMLATGCRISEALALRWEDVRLDAPTEQVAITGSVVQIKGRGMVLQDHPKSKGSQLAYTVDAPVLDMLCRRWERMTELGAIGPMVFPSSTGSLRDPSSFRTQWRKAARAIGFEWVTPHTFRKTVADRIDKQRGLSSASRYLGHSNEAVTAGHYVMRTKAAADMREVLSGFWADPAKDAAAS